MYAAEENRGIAGAGSLLLLHTVQNVQVMAGALMPFAPSLLGGAALQLGSP